MTAEVLTTSQIYLTEIQLNKARPCDIEAPILDFDRGLSCKPNIYVSWSTSELRVKLARRETGLNAPVRYFIDRSKAVLLLWIFNVFVLPCVCYVFVHVCLYVHCGHLLRKGWPLRSRLWCLTVSLSLSHWYPGSGVVLDCIDSWHPYLPCQWIIA